MFDWKEYHLLARDLLSQADNSPQKEAVLRSAVSRAYYAAFHAADAYLKSTKNYPSMQEDTTHSEGSHNRIINIFLTDTNHPAWEQIGKRLRRLKNFRHWADYNPLGTEFRDINQAALKVKEAGEIIKLIRSL